MCRKKTRKNRFTLNMFLQRSAVQYVADGRRGAVMLSWRVQAACLSNLRRICLSNRRAADAFNSRAAGWSNLRGANLSSGKAAFQAPVAFSVNTSSNILQRSIKLNCNKNKTMQLQSNMIGIPTACRKQELWTREWAVQLYCPEQTLEILLLHSLKPS